MKKEILKRIFDFLEGNEKKSHKAKGTLLWKIVFNEPLTKEDLDIKGDLNLGMKDITSLPKGLKVGGKLNLEWSNIISLPEGLEVKGELSLAYTSIRTLPKSLKVGSLNLMRSEIESLPEGLKVDGVLNLLNTGIKSLPKGLEVGGDLYLELTTMMKYERYELLEMIKPGFVKGKIHR